MLGSKNSEHKTTVNNISISQLTIPKGGGAIEGIGQTFEANLFTGSATLSIPISTTPCRGFEPHLSLQYSSGAGNGPFGLGFSLSPPRIARKTSKGQPRYDNDDSFIWFGDDIVPVDGSTTYYPNQAQPQYKVVQYRSRTDTSFARIEHWLDLTSNEIYWRITDKNNVTDVFGKSNNARIVNPIDNGQVFAWLLEESFDAKGNRIVYVYKGEDGKNKKGETIAETAVYEQNRTQTAQKYIERVKYGPYTASTKADSDDWRFEIVFDYGEYTIAPTNANPYKATDRWSVREDSFSDYKAGFEIRTHRLCRNIMVFHRFTEIFGADPILVSATSFDYDENKNISRLLSVTHSGYRYQASAAYDSQSLPPLTFGYTPFQPEGRSFETLILQENDRFVSGLDAPPHYMLVDLYGEGIPGILFNDNKTILYAEPRRGQNGDGAVQYSSPQPVPSFPLPRNPEGRQHLLTDLTGNGHMDLVVSTPTMAGFYECQADRSWLAFQPFDSFPTNFTDSNNNFLDVTGDGRTDVVHVEQTAVTSYQSKGKLGFQAPHITPKENGLPWPHNFSETEAIRFADIMGTGTQHMVHIRSGSVTCWPNLGYGRFGRKVTLGNAPHFGDHVNVDRIFLADIDGSGTADLAIVYPHSVEIYLNQSGNAFAATPITIPLPIPYDQITQIQFADVQGNGAQCLVISQNQPEPRHWYYNFGQGQKPYLINQLNDNMGRETEITYASSTEFYLTDKMSGHKWLTTLPFPVQVVKQIKHIDQISKTSLVSSFHYAHGHYDSIDREFRGFGRVEQIDAESFQGIAHYQTPPILTKTWFHTGAWQNELNLHTAYQKEYYQTPYRLPDSVLNDNQSNNTHELYHALQHEILRQEIYGLDGDAHQNIPYTISENNYTVNLEQAIGKNRYAICTVHEREVLSQHLERTPDDPRIEHDFILKVDDTGDVLQSCAVAYGRQQNGLPQQSSVKVTFVQHNYVPGQNTKDTYLQGMAQENKVYEIQQVPWQKGQQFTFAEAAKFAPDATPTPTSRLLTWQQFIYWSPDSKAALPLGQITPQALLHQMKTAELGATAIEQLFSGILDKTQLNTLLNKQGGYEKNADYWWNPGLTQSYNPADKFYFPSHAADPFGNTTTYIYDSYNLILTKVEDALQNVTSAHDIDYQIVKPQIVENPNKNISEVRYDTLGHVYVTSNYGTEEGKDVGFMKLTDYKPPAIPANKTDVVNNPATYLKNAAAYFYYNYNAWTAQTPEPTHHVDLMATNYPGKTPQQTQIQIAYFDGFGRTVCHKKNAEGGTAVIVDANNQLQLTDGKPTIKQSSERWLTSGRTEYDNKGNPTRQYEPYYINTADYIDHDILNQFGVVAITHYDALSRPIRTDTPKGFFTKIIHTVWDTSHYDANDTVKSSQYYQDNINNNDHDFIWERQALQKAALFDNTPTQQINDNLGHTIIIRRKNEGIVTIDNLKTVGLSDSQVKSLRQNLRTNKIIDFRNALTPAFDPTTPLKLDAQFTSLEPQIRTLLSQVQQNGQILETHMTYDIQGRILSSADARLSATSHQNFQMTYGMTKLPLKKDGVDNGARWQLYNSAGNLIYSKDSRNFELAITYDQKDRPIQTQITGGDGETPLNNIVSRNYYGDSLEPDGKTPYFPKPESANLRGQIALKFDQAGSVAYKAYALTGQPLQATRTHRKDYKTEAHWQDDEIDILNKQLDSNTYSSKTSCDALGRVVEETDPAQNVTQSTYSLTGHLQQLQVTPKETGTAETYIKHIAYNAKGQRTSIIYGEDTLTTTYTYDEKTFNLTNILTKRPSDSATLQNLNYTYDPVGHLTHTIDKAFKTVFSGQQKISPDSDYTYDALYQLIKATGREHPGLTQQDYKQGGMNAAWVAPRIHVNEDQKLKNYSRTFAYDLGNNLTTIQHKAENNSWTRKMTVAATSNRAVIADLADQPAQVDTFFDKSGNQIKTNTSSKLAWNYRNQLQTVTLLARSGAPSDVEYYIYDSAGRRLRKITERYANGGKTLNSEETRYFGGFEIHLSKQNDTVQTERHTINVLDGEHPLARRLWWKQGAPPNRVRNNTQTRHQLSNQLGSCALEINGAGHIISYEEYYPFGGTAFVAGSNFAEVKLRQYRFNDKERDNSTGLYYFGARYYAPWLARWLSPDPAGTVDGLNLYSFVSGNPISFSDPTGQGKHNKQLTVHGKTRSRPLRHAAMNTRFEKLGRRIGQHLSVTKPTAKTLSMRVKQRARFKARRLARSLGVQNDSTVLKAITHGLAGNKTQFAYYYRSAHAGMDEHLSTATVFNLLKGIGMHQHKFSSSAMAELEDMVTTISHMRMPTGMSGYSMPTGVMQHPTGAGQAMFGRSGQNHGYADRMRREQALATGEHSSSSGLALWGEMAVTATQQTVNWFAAPATGGNVSTLGTVSSKQKQAQVVYRDMSKQDMGDLGGLTLSQTPQPMTASWMPTENPTAPPSPRRGPVFPKDYNFT
ncbi:MAG: hypothetical protein GY805_09165 [Chloroflexi bacterium]|nr:hypothetical protein [Chloroflexota bacterium]